MVDFASIQNSKSEISSQKRIGKKDILPREIKFRLQEFYDPSDKTYKFKDNNGNAIFTIDPAAATITFGSAITFTTVMTFSNTVNFDGATDFDGTNVFDGAVTFNGTVTKGVAVVSFVKEFIIPITSAGAASGSNDSFYTDVATYKNLSDGEFIFDPADYPSATFNLEVVGRAGASGDSLRTLSVQLYNVTTGAAIASSLAETTTTSGTPIEDPGSWVRFRSSAITFTTGSNTYIAQFKTDTGGSFVDVQRIGLVIRY